MVKQVQYKSLNVSEFGSLILNFLRYKTISNSLLAPLGLGAVAGSVYRRAKRSYAAYHGMYEASY